MDESLVAVEQAMAACQQVSLEPALAHMLAQDLHDTSVGREVIVAGHRLGVPCSVRGFEDRTQPVRDRLVRAHDPEVVGILLHDVAEVGAHDARRLARRRARARHLDGVVAEVWKPQVYQQLAAVGVRVRAHPAIPRRRQAGELVHQPARAVEELFDVVAAHPFLEDLDVVRMRCEIGDRHLVRAERAFDLLAVDDLRAGPTLGCTQDEHRPRRTSLLMIPIRPGRRRLPGHLPPRRGKEASAILDARYLIQRPLERGRHLLVHLRRVIAADDHRLMAVATHQLKELALRDAGEHRRVGDLVAVEMKDGQHRTVASRVEELVRVPASRQGS